MAPTFAVGLATTASFARDLVHIFHLQRGVNVKNDPRLAKRDQNAWSNLLIRCERERISHGSYIRIFTPSRLRSRSHTSPTAASSASECELFRMNQSYMRILPANYSCRKPLLGPDFIVRYTSRRPERQIRRSRYSSVLYREPTHNIRDTGWPVWFRLFNLTLSL